MGVEIERKFLVQPSWHPAASGEEIAQGYLSSVPERTVRVRIRGAKGYLTVKGKNGGADAARRAEFEYEIPVADARAMLALCELGLCEKVRHPTAMTGKSMSFMAGTRALSSPRWSSARKTSRSSGQAGSARKSQATNATTIRAWRSIPMKHGSNYEKSTC